MKPDPPPPPPPPNTPPDPPDTNGTLTLDRILENIETPPEKKPETPTEADFRSAMYDLERASRAPLVICPGCGSWHACRPNPAGDALLLGLLDSNTTIKRGPIYRKTKDNP